MKNSHPWSFQPQNDRLDSMITEEFTINHTLWQRIKTPRHKPNHGMCSQCTLVNEKLSKLKTCLIF